MEIITLAAALFLAWVLVSWLLKRYPHTKCFRCKGSGKDVMPVYARRYRACPRCGGTGRKR